MKRALESAQHSALVRHPKLVATAIGLAMLLIASAAQAAGRGSAQGHDVARGATGSAAAEARTRGIYSTTMVGLEVRFKAPLAR